MTYPIEPEDHSTDHSSAGHDSYTQYGKQDGEQSNTDELPTSSYFDSSDWPGVDGGSSSDGGAPSDGDYRSHYRSDYADSSNLDSFGEQDSSRSDGYTFDALSQRSAYQSSYQSPYESESSHESSSSYESPYESSYQRNGHASQAADAPSETNSFTLSAPPPPPAPVRDPHPELSTEWTYTPTDQPSVIQPPPAKWGWRGRLRAATGGLVALQPGRHEQDYREALSTISSSLPGSRTIVIANEKGGAGKTPTALILSALLAEQRREPVIAWDVNELRGTLGRRAEVTEPTTTVTDMLAAAPELARPDAEVGVLASYLRRQPEGNLVLASSEDGNAMRQMGHAECDVIRQLLLRRYGLVVCDTGNNAAASNFLYTVDSGDVLVVPTAPSGIHLEVARAMLRMLASRETTAHLVPRAVLVVTSPTGKRLSPEEEDWFAHRVGRVVHVPADPVIGEGGKLPISSLSTASRHAWTEVAAAVIEAAMLPSTKDRGAGRGKAAELDEVAPYTFDDAGSKPIDDETPSWNYGSDYSGSSSSDSDYAGSSSSPGSGTFWDSSTSNESYFG